MPRHLPLLVERSVAEAQASRILAAEQFETKVLKDGAVSCSAGCSNCCYYPLSISILEGLSIYRWLLKHHLWTTKLQMKLQETDKKTWDLSPDIWLLSKIPCPLLDEKKQCSAYEARPFLCRTMYSRGDPHYCDPHRFGMNTTIRREAEVDTIWTAEKAILRKHSLRQVLIPFSSAILLAEKIVNGEIEIEDTNTTLLMEHVTR